MGEKYTMVIFGAWAAELPKPPEVEDEEVWNAWLAAKQGVSTYRPGPTLNGLRISTPYESRPRWVGFLVDTLEHGNAIDLTERSPGVLKARAAWDQLCELARDELGPMPPGYFIIAHDQ